MRKIKFRLFGKNSKEFLRPENQGLDLKELQNVCDIDVWHVMQFTGFQDSKGVDIYEGDLIEKDDGKFVKCGAVSFIHGCWMVASKSGEQYFNLHWYLSQAEVIGNIYQNPELLRGATNGKG